MSGSMKAALAFGLDKIGGVSLLRAVGDRYRIERKGGVPRFHRRSGAPFQILIYHRVNSVQKPFMLDTIDVGWFERQMAYLSRHYHLLSLRQMLALAETGDLPPGAMAVTFDDGYQDNFTHAFPILKKYGVPATIFLATGSIGTGVPLWYEQVLIAFERTQSASFTDPRDGRAYDITPVGDRRALVFRILPELMKMEAEERLRVVKKIIRALGEAEEISDPDLMLTWDQVRQMRREGIEFGAHTVTHPILSRQKPEGVWWELVTSKSKVESELQEEIPLFAYPNGKPDDYNPGVIEMVKKAGFRCAVTTSFGINQAGTDPYQWRRGVPWEKDISLFALKLAFYRTGNSD
jgi:peptidoglycan/xylan/chitin deacetylase (PgdA/CDA1 family)